jgi:hypothetical protein
MQMKHRRRACNTRFFFQQCLSNHQKKGLDCEKEIQKAIIAFENNQFPSITAAADHFQVSYWSLRRRLHGGLTQSQSHEMQQILTSTEEATLVRWIKQYIITGTPITNSLLKELAQNLRAARVTHASRSITFSPHIDQINHKSVYRFQNKHPEVGSIYARQLEHARKDRASYEHVERWFNVVASKVKEHAYSVRNGWIGSRIHGRGSTDWRFGGGPWIGWQSGRWRAYREAMTLRLYR